MFCRMLLSTLLLFTAPAFAEGDELDAVPAHALIGHGYFSESTPSEILFINLRRRPVRLLWVAFDGSERPYGVLAEGEQVLQPTYVAHRWLVRDAGDDAPLEGFIATHAIARSNETPQVALIR